MDQVTPGVFDPDMHKFLTKPEVWMKSEKIPLANKPIIHNITCIDQIWSHHDIMTLEYLSYGLFFPLRMHVEEMGQCKPPD